MPFQRSVFAFLCSDDKASVAKDFATICEAGDPTLYGGGLCGAAHVTGPNHANAIILAEIGNLPCAMACECVTEITSHWARVVAFGAPDDIGTCRAVRDAGAVDCLSFLVDPRAFLAALSGTKPAAPKTERMATNVGILGAKGGVGASTLTHNLAALTAADA